MCANSVKQMIRKFEATGSLDIAWGRGQCATAPTIVEEVAIATAKATARSSNATVSGQSRERALDIPWKKSVNYIM